MGEGESSPWHCFITFSFLWFFAPVIFLKIMLGEFSWVLSLLFHLDSTLRRALLVSLLNNIWLLLTPCVVFLVKILKWFAISFSSIFKHTEVRWLAQVVTQLVSTWSQIWTQVFLTLGPALYTLNHLPAFRRIRDCYFDQCQFCWIHLHTHTHVPNQVKSILI